MTEKIHEKPMRPGGEKRGNSYARRARKNRLLSDPQFQHTESHSEPNVHCEHCGTMLTYATVESDRKDPKQGYAYHNIQPACRSCNLARSNNTSWVPPKARTEVAATA